MNKKEYMQPSIDVKNIDRTDIICMSSGRATLGIGNPEDEDEFVPKTDEGGYMWGE